MSSNPILSVIGEIFRPFAELVDNLHTSKEEKIELRNKAMQIQTALTLRAIRMQESLTEAQARIIEAEAKGESWLQRNWRPLTMLTFLTLIVCDVYGWLEFRLSERAWDVLELGLGGYVIGRSVEKVVDRVGLKASDFTGNKK